MARSPPANVRFPEPFETVDQTRRPNDGSFYPLREEGQDAGAGVLNVTQHEGTGECCAAARHSEQISPACAEETVATPCGGPVGRRRVRDSHTVSGWTGCEGTDMVVQWKALDPAWPLTS
jgi:hypothetical protein